MNFKRRKYRSIRSQIVQIGYNMMVLKIEKRTIEFQPMPDFFKHSYQSQPFNF